MMVRRCNGFMVVVSLLALSACSGGSVGGSAGPVTIATADLSASRLQFAVGTANFAPPPPGSDLPAPNGPILNLVETFRQPNGTSALLSDVVSISGPAGFVVVSPTSGVKNDGGASNLLLNSLAGYAAFGESFASNTNQFGIATAVGSYSANPGGPPAFPRTTDGNYPPGFNYAANIVGIGGNVQTFPNGFPLGTYTLQVSTPPGSGQAHTWSASGKLASMTTLPLFAAPLLSFDGTGGGSVSFVVPSKITELFVSVTATDSCWPFEAATNTVTSGGAFSFFLRLPKVGPFTLAIPDNLGPPITNGNAPTFCSSAQNTAATAANGFAAAGAAVTVQVIGADYPLYELSYPQSTAQLPPLTGSGGQSDVTVSAQTMGTAP